MPTNLSEESKPEPLTNVRGLIIDMDGVLWHGNTPIPGLQAFFNTIKELELPFVLATNNASLTQDQYVSKLFKMGVAVDKSEIMTSAMATALYLRQYHNPSTTKIYVIGEQGARLPLQQQGFLLTGTYDPANITESKADIVVCGKDETLSWEKLASATLNLRAGAKLVGTNGDVTLPTERGLTHGNGAILAALQSATNVEPIIIGKPEPIIYQQALELLGLSPDKTIAIGDRLDTDILGAVRANLRSLMVLTGVSTEQDIENSDFKPTWVMPDIRAVTQALQL